MKTKMNKFKFYLMIVSFFVGLGFLIFSRYEVFGSFCLNVGFVLFFLHLIKRNRTEIEVKGDERDRQINLRATFYSWVSTFICVNMLFWFDYFFPLRLDPSKLLSFLLFFMLITISFLKVFLRKI